jgi:putative endonuclease
MPPPSRFHYVYVLRSLRDGRLYVGSTGDLRRRLELHNSGLVTSTKPRRPLELIFYEAYRNEYDAKRRESYLKTSKGRSSLKVMLAEFLQAGGGPAGRREGLEGPAPSERRTSENVATVTGHTNLVRLHPLK